METQPLIRRAERRDLSAVALLAATQRDLLGRDRPTRGELERRLGRMQADPAVTIGVAVADGALLGYALQRRHCSLWDAGGVAVLHDLFVAETARRRGLGRRLLQHALREARAAGCGLFSLDANERNAPALALSVSEGFTGEGEGWSGGRQLRHELRLETEAQVDPGIRWGPWMIKW